MKTVSGLDMPSIITVGVIGTLLTISSIVGITALYGWYYDKVEAENWAKASQTTFQKIKAEQNGKLATYGYMDDKKEIVHIPINEAMKKVVEQHAKK